MKEDITFPNNKIRIGQNKEENDKIITEADQTDIWFHLANFPSCHVIIKCNKKFPIDKEMIYYCATLVKENTKYKNFKKIKINYCPIKNIKKTNEKGKVIIKGRIDTVII